MSAATCCAAAAEQLDPLDSPRRNAYDVVHGPELTRGAALLLAGEGHDGSLSWYTVACCPWCGTKVA